MSDDHVDQRRVGRGCDVGSSCPRYIWINGVRPHTARTSLYINLSVFPVFPRFRSRSGRRYSIPARRLLAPPRIGFYSPPTLISVSARQRPSRFINFSEYFLPREFDNVHYVNYITHARPNLPPPRYEDVAIWSRDSRERVATAAPLYSNFGNETIFVTPTPTAANLRFPPHPRYIQISRGPPALALL